MKFINGEIINDTKEDIKSFFVNGILNIFSSNSKPENNGLLMQIVNLLVDYEFEIQDKINWLYTQFSPDNAKNFLQDALFERIGVSRLGATRKIVKIRLKALPGTKIKENSVQIKNTSDNSLYKNLSELYFNDDGYSDAEFISLEYSTTSSDMTFKVFSAPVKLYIDTDYPVEIVLDGREKESDAMYKSRYDISKAIKACVTRSGNLSNLALCADSLSDIKILTKTSSPEMHSGTMRIIARPNVSDYEFAQQILNTVGLGVKFLGNTCVSLKDDCGIPLIVKFDKAREINMSIYISVLCYSGAQLSDVVQKIKDSIMSFVREKPFGLGVDVYSSEFVIPVSKCSEVSNLLSIKLKKDSSEEKVNKISFQVDEKPIINENFIFIEEVTDDSI